VVIKRRGQFFAHGIRHHDNGRMGWGVERASFATEHGGLDELLYDDCVVCRIEHEYGQMLVNKVTTATLNY